ncbi:MAG: hypothetical protein K2X09_01960 [Rickettsiales bacterium]|nr:hypothetical protein [Rickettsiales bacterium]
MSSSNGATPLTEAMIQSFPAVDPHVHVPGTISPQTAWDLGLRNGLIHMARNRQGKWEVVDGPKSIGASDPVKQYSHIFTSKGGHELTFDKKGNPLALDYNYFCLPEQPDKFSGFDAIQGTTQGHRHRPGGIQTEDDYRFVMQRYLESCLTQNIKYVEPSQNITISQVLYPELPASEARSKFFQLAKELVAHYAAHGVVLRFTHCANKTGAANVPGSLKQRAHDWVDWLAQAVAEVPGVFVGMTTAGHEGREIESGGPDAMADGYHRLKPLGLLGEGHYGEGAGVEHLDRALECLSLDRLAHAVQMIESTAVLNKIRERDIPIIMMPYINLSLGTTVHYKDGKPHSKYMTDGKTRDPDVEKKYLQTLEEHPFFPLLREHRLPIALASDDPQQGGIDYNDQVKLLAGLTYAFKPGFAPLSAEELVICNLNAVHAAFCEPEVKQHLIALIAQWVHDQKLHVTHPLLSTVS